MKGPPRPDKAIFQPPPLPPEKPKESEPPSLCPFARMDEDSAFIRRQDLIDLGNKFTSAVKPIGGLTGLVREQNEVQRDTNRCVKVTGKRQSKHSWLMLAMAVGFVTVAVVLIHASVMLNRASVKQDEVIESAAQSKKELEDVTKELKELVALTKKTKEKVEDIKKKKEGESEVQLVVETDPVKARKAPMKVRILPPRKRGSAPPASSAVELPIHSKAL